MTGAKRVHYRNTKDGVTKAGKGNNNIKNKIKTTNISIKSLVKQSEKTSEDTKKNNLLINALEKYDKLSEEIMESDKLTEADKDKLLDRILSEKSKIQRKIDKNQVQNDEMFKKQISKITGIKMSDSKFVNNIVTSKQKEQLPGIEDIIGQKDALKAINGNLTLSLEYPNLASVAGTDNGFLLYGPPGTGKTDISKAIAKEKDVNFIEVGAEELLGSDFGESPKNIQELFEFARANSPSVVFIDEIDAIATERSGNTTGAENRVVTSLLRNMEGFNSAENEGVFVIGATNKPDNIDPAIKRRFKKRQYVGLPTEEDRKEIIKKQLSQDDLKLINKKSIDIDELVKTTKGYSFDDIKTIMDDVTRSPILESVLNDDIENLGKKHLVAHDDYINAFNDTPPATSREQMKEYEEFEDGNQVINEPNNQSDVDKEKKNPISNKRGSSRSRKRSRRVRQSKKETSRPVKRESSTPNASKRRVRNVTIVPAETRETLDEIYDKANIDKDKRQYGNFHVTSQGEKRPLIDEDIFITPNGRFYDSSNNRVVSREKIGELL